MFDFLAGIDEQLRAPLITASATCISALLGFTAVFIQIGRQGRNAVRANTKNEQIKRKVEIYELTLETSRAAQAAASDLTAYLQRFRTSLLFASFQAENKLPVYPPRENFLEYSELSERSSAAFIAVMTMIESWHIIEPRLDVFRLAMAVGLSELRKSTHAPDILIPQMVVPGHESTWRSPTEAQFKVIDARIEKEADALSRLSAWVADFQVEMQILLLSDLFPNKVVRRQPPDPTKFCIRLDRYAEIMRKLEDTEWIRDGERLDAEARLRFSPQRTDTKEKWFSRLRWSPSRRV